MALAGTLLLAVGTGAYFLLKPSAPPRPSDALSPLVPEESLKATRMPLPAGEARAPGELDLLDLIDVPKDAVAGAWGFQDRGLITASTQWGRLQVPCVLPEEFDLKMTVCRKRGVNSLNLGFPFLGSQGMLVLDGWDGRTQCLMLGDGSNPSTNETSVTNRKVFKWNLPTSIMLSVRKTGITLSVGGKPLIDWKGSSSELFFSSGFNVPNPRTLVLASWESVFRIDECLLTPIGGTPTLLRPAAVVQTTP
jgi:hypothetical protein